MSPWSLSCSDRLEGSRVELDYPFFLTRVLKVETIREKLNEIARDSIKSNSNNRHNKFTGPDFRKLRDITSLTVDHVCEKEEVGK